MRPFSRRRTGSIIALLLCGCFAPPLESPQPGTQCSPRIEVSQTVRNKVDILFMVDNSNSMLPMSGELQNRFNQFLKVFSDLAAAGTYSDLQIGVVTSDYGAGARGAPGCQASPGGQQGKLQALGGSAAANCKPPLGANFLKYAFTADGKNPNNLPAAQDLNATFTCMASVGGSGCGFEHQLESVYAALHNNLPENAGFLRDDALLAVVFLTNEDDSSAPPDTDMFDVAKIAQYGFEDSYRQTRFGVVCGDPGTLTPYGDSMGPLSHCQAAPNLNGAGPGREYDISRYIDFFTRPASQGGIKRDPEHDVILVGIDAPADPVQIILSNPGTPGGLPYAPCAVLDETSNPPCVPVLQHSCVNPANSVFFGDPSVRLNAVINSAKHHSLSSICDADFTGALQKVANEISSHLVPGCVPGHLPDRPDCVVEDVIPSPDGTTVVRELPQCSNPATAYPCWTLDKKKGCDAISPDGMGFTINRNGMFAPEGTVARIECGALCP